MQDFCRCVSNITIMVILVIPCNLLQIDAHAGMGETMRTYTLTFTEQEVTTIIKALDIAGRYIVENACNGKMTESEANNLFKSYFYVKLDISEATERPITV